MPNTAPEAGVLSSSVVPIAEPRWRRVLLYLALAELILIYAPTVRWLFDRWTLSVWHHAHGLLIPPVVAYFVYQELRPLRSQPASSSWWGLPVLGFALLLHALDAGMQTQLLSSLSLIVALPGLSLLMLGTRRTWAIAFPLAFLLFALPIPLGLTETIHWQLRLIVTAAIGWLVPLVGIPVFIEGTTVQVAKGALQVADACSGFSTLYAAAAVACLTAYTAAGWGRKLLVLVAAAPIAIAANVLRVALLVALTAWRGPEILETAIHPLSGMATFVMALPVIFWLGGSPVRERAS
jgi:exosortase